MHTLFFSLAFVTQAFSAPSPETPAPDKARVVEEEREKDVATARAARERAVAKAQAVELGQATAKAEEPMRREE